jgi:competence protein ComEC
MWLGMLAVAAGQIAALGPAFEWAADGLAGAIGWLAAVPLDYLSGLASWFASLSWAQLQVPVLSTGGVVAAFGLLGACLLAVARVSRRTGARAAAVAGSVRMLGRSQRAAMLIAGLGLVCLVSVPLVEAPDPPRDLTVRFLDVGQGDATLIQDPSGAAILFDGGREDARVAALLRQAGVSRLALVVATHQSADHHGGLAEVLTSYPVDMLLENGDGTTDPTFLAMLDAARRAGVPITTARAGQVLRVGGLVVRVLWPPPRPPGPAPEDPNPRAMVAIVSAGAFDLFLSADAESPTLLPLDLPPVEAMKVPHHGSSDPGLPELLTRLRPSIAAIEVGADNTYGHPHPSTLAALRAAAVRVYRTDRDGTVSLTVAGGAMIVDTYR